MASTCFIARVRQPTKTLLYLANLWTFKCFYSPLPSTNNFPLQKCRVGIKVSPQSIAIYNQTLALWQIGQGQFVPRKRGRGDVDGPWARAPLHRRLVYPGNYWTNPRWWVRQRGTSWKFPLETRIFRALHLNGQFHGNSYWNVLLLAQSKVYMTVDIRPESIARPNENL